jgi:hypothetical protein
MTNNSIIFFTQPLLLIIWSGSASDATWGSWLASLPWARLELAFLFYRPWFRNLPVVGWEPVWFACTHYERICPFSARLAHGEWIALLILIIFIF